MMKNKILERIFWTIILLIIWQIVYWSGKFSPLVFPSLRDIFKAMFNSIVNGNLLDHLLFSLLLILQGILISILLALFLAITGHFSRLAASLIDTIIAAFHPLPGIALMPLVLIWFGSGRQAILFIIIHSVLWPIVLNLKTGLNSVSDIYIMIGKNYGLSKVQILIQIMTPASLPYFLAGLKIAWARSWRALISAEMLFGAINSIGGLGWFIFQKRVFFDLPGVFAGIIVIIIIGILVEDLVFNIIERATVDKWGMKS
ncbi:MAG: ABC transporter permease [bacterium]